MTSHDDAVTAVGNALRKRWLAEGWLTPLNLDPMDWAEAAVDAARPHLAAAERERIALLAERYDAICWTDDSDDQPFADLLRGPTPPEGDPS